MLIPFSAYISNINYLLSNGFIIGVVCLSANGWMLLMFKCTGLTLLELLFTIAIIALVTSLAAPLVTSMQKKLQLKSAIQTGYFALQQARSSAISKGMSVSMVFQSGKYWRFHNDTARTTDHPAAA